MLPVRNDVYKRTIDKNVVLEIIQDEDYRNPREDNDCNLGTMVCWHSRYDLGDKHDYSEPRDFLESLAEELHGTESDYVQKKADEYISSFKIIQNDDDIVIMDDETIYRDGYDSFESAGRDLDELRDEYVNEFFEDRDEEELLALISEKAVILPLYLYDHSGITMNTTGFSCGWDSGQVGWIYCTHEKFLEETGYSEDELFNTDTQRLPKISDHVKVVGYEDRFSDYGLVKSIDNDKVTIDFDYNKVIGFKKPENIVIVDVNEIIEVLSDQAEQMLVNEVETYDQYLTGEVYGYRLSELDREGLDEYLAENEMEESELSNDELDGFMSELDSCWGFYGDNFKENGVKDNLSQEYEYLVDKLESVH